jgi:predicted DNA-binding protein
MNIKDIQTYLNEIERHLLASSALKRIRSNYLAAWLSHKQSKNATRHTGWLNDRVPLEYLRAIIR